MLKNTVSIAQEVIFYLQAEVYEKKPKKNNNNLQKKL